MLDFTRRAWLEIDLNCIRHNLQVLRKHLDSGVEIMAVVKADAYGNGIRKISLFLQEEGIRFFGVASLSEAIALREAGITGEILILSYVDINYAEYLLQYDLTQTIVDYSHARALNQMGVKLNCRIKAHIKLDTGMHRVGLSCETEGDIAKISEIYTMDHLMPLGIFSHLCTADEKGSECSEYAELQISRFNSALDRLASSKTKVGIVHLCNTGGVLKYPYAQFDMVRCGSILYGYNTAYGIQKWPLKYAHSMKTIIFSVKDLEANVPVGYGLTYRTGRLSRIATIGVGAADGFTCHYSNAARVMVRGKWANVVGRVCMDQSMIDVTDIPGVATGDVVTIFGRDGDLVQSVQDLAEAAQTSRGELLSILSQPRLEKVYLDTH